METTSHNPAREVDGPRRNGDGATNGRDDHAHDEGIPTDLPRVRTPAVIVVAVVTLLAFGGLFLLGWMPRQHQAAELREQSAALSDDAPSVLVTQPKRTDKPQDLILPADVRARQETSLFPRANGYLKRVLVDIGDRVEAGQLLAEIEQPDVDADLNQAKASYALSNANLIKAQNDFELAQTTLKRYEGFAQSGGVTQQQLDEKRAGFTQMQSALAAAQANVKVSDAAIQRLTSMQAFEKVTAPFAGTITARNYDVGALMSATNTAQGRELFRIADVSTLRVYVNVPQTYATAVKTGQEAALIVRNYGGQEFAGRVVRSAGALDPATRTLRYEIQVPNDKGTLYAGMYGQAKLAVTQTQSPMVVPTSALVFDAQGTKVWTVEDGKAHARTVDVGRDFGTEVEIESGLKGDESVVTNPGDRLADNVQVHVTTPRDAEPAPARPTNAQQQQALAK
jgi:RND family efflux transporter MFP subunit